MAGQGDVELPEDVAIRRKTAAQKDNNHMLRQQQIISYKIAMLKEARARRSRLRHYQFLDLSLDQNIDELSSPKKRKKVDFNLQTEESVDLKELPQKTTRKTRSST